MTVPLGVERVRARSGTAAPGAGRSLVAGCAACWSSRGAARGVLAAGLDSRISFHFSGTGMGMLIVIVVLIQLVNLSHAAKVLVLGGTGFVGQRFISSAITHNNELEIVAISRRGRPTGTDDSSNKLGQIKWISGDAGDVDFLKEIHQTHGPFDACKFPLPVITYHCTSLPYSDH